MKNIDLSQVEENKDFVKLPAGGYVVKISKVDDFPDKEYLMIEYDIAEGEHKGYYVDLFSRMNFWGGKFYRSYKSTALSFFKGFLTAVSNSNQGFAWTSNEQQLVGKLVGIVLGEETNPNKQDGSTRLYLDQVRSIDQIRNKSFTVPVPKGIDVSDAKQAFKGSEVTL